MNAPQSFIDLLYSADCSQDYIGMGNPNAHILIIGREPMHDLNNKDEREKQIAIENYYQDQELNRINWINLIEGHAVKGRCNPRHPFPNQKYQCRRRLKKSQNNDEAFIGKDGTAQTWFNYQKLVDAMLGRNARNSDDLIDFHDYCFHTDISSASAKNILTVDKRAKMISVEKRSRELFSHPFFRQFPIIILAIGTDLGPNKYIPENWCEKVLGFPGIEVEWIMSNETNGKHRWLNINRDSKGCRILIHTQSLSQTSNAYIDKIREVICRDGFTDDCWPKEY